MVLKEAFDKMTDNALNYLRLAPRDWIHHYDQCAIKVYTAVELFLKARLLSEHWSIIVSKGPQLDKFQTGDFVSVTFEEACKRLDQIAGEPLPKEAYEAFNKLRIFRNQVVHFGLSAPVNHSEAVERERTTRKLIRDAWNELSKLLHRPWSDLFKDHMAEIIRIEDMMIKNSTPVNLGFGLPKATHGTVSEAVTDYETPLLSDEELDEIAREVKELDEKGGQIK